MRPPTTSTEASRETAAPAPATAARSGWSRMAAASVWSVHRVDREDVDPVGLIGDQEDAAVGAAQHLIGGRRAHQVDPAVRVECGRRGAGVDQRLSPAHARRRAGCAGSRSVARAVDDLPAAGRVVPVLPGRRRGEQRRAPRPRTRGTLRWEAATKGSRRRNRIVRQSSAWHHRCPPHGRPRLRPCSFPAASARRSPRSLRACGAGTAPSRWSAGPATAVP